MLISVSYESLYPMNESFLPINPQDRIEGVTLKDRLIMLEKLGYHTNYCVMLVRRKESTTVKSNRRWDKTLYSFVSGNPMKNGPKGHIRFHKAFFFNKSMMDPKKFDDFEKGDLVYYPHINCGSYAVNESPLSGSVKVTKLEVGDGVVENPGFIYSFKPSHEATFIQSRYEGNSWVLNELTSNLWDPVHLMKGTCSGKSSKIIRIKETNTILDARDTFNKYKMVPFICAHNGGR